MSRRLPVAVDAMGGDHAPAALVEGALRAREAGIATVLVGDEALLRPLDSSLPIVHTVEAIDMGEGASAVVRRKPRASVRVCAEMVGDGRACAMFTSGNTGAAMVAAVHELGTLGSIRRPAVAVPLPRVDGGWFLLLDAGANVDCQAEQLVAFARMGHAWARAALSIEHPRIGVLSNGAEPNKGNQLVREALEALSGVDGLDVVGPMEPTEAFAGACDVLVCDGFVGNVLLKSVEGVAATLTSLIRAEVGRSRASEIGAWLISGAIRRLRSRVAWEARGGALLLGVDGVVAIGHGRADAEAVANGIALAWRSAESGLLAAVRRELA